MKIPVDFDKPESIYKEPTCYEKCILAAKCGGSVGLCFGTLMYYVGTVKAKVPKGQRLYPSLIAGTCGGVLVGSILTGFARANC